MNYHERWALRYQRLKSFVKKLLITDAHSDPLQLERLNAQLQQEIHDRQLAEATLRESQSLYQAIVEDQIELICRFDVGGILTFVNQAYCRYFQHELADVLGHSFLEILSERSQSESELVCSAILCYLSSHDTSTALYKKLFR